MRFRFLGDHAAEHCGCQAVTQVITAELSAHGSIVGPRDEYDALVVNGEGSMHHGKRNWLVKMDAIRMAQAAGKRTWLINTLWDSNPGGYDDCLAALDGLTLRGVASARDLAQRHGLQAAHRIDVSFACPIDESATPLKLAGKVAVTDLWVPGFDFVWLPHRGDDPWTRVDLRRASWSSLVRGLRQARVLITGRHHGMYAACKARLPFIPIRGNAHKFEDLLDSAKSPIPIAERRSEIEGLLGWARANPRAYDDLFDWMAEQEPWRFDPAAAGPDRPNRMPSAPPPPHLPPPHLPPTRTLLDRANAAFVRRDPATAAPLWREVLAQSGDRLPNPRAACTVFFNAGDVPLAMQVMASARTAQPASVSMLQLVMGWARDPNVWIDRTPGTGWWDDLKAAAHLARTGDLSGSQGMAANAVAQAASAQGPVFAGSVRFLLACKLAQLGLPLPATALWLHCPVADQPAWADRQERLLFNALCCRADPETLSLLDLAPGLACWADPAFRATVLRHRLAITGPTPALLADLAATCDSFATRADLRDILFAAAAEAGDWSCLGADAPAHAAFSEQTLLDAAPLHLGVATLLHRQGHSGSHRQTRLIAERAALLAAFLAGRDRLAQWLADPSVRLAVVGQAPLSPGQASRINAADLVIRVGAAPAQTGIRTDVLILAGPCDRDVLAGTAGRVGLIVQHDAAHVYDPRDWTPVLDALADGQAFGLLPRSAFTSAAAQLGRSPGPDLTLACLIRGLRGAFDQAEFYGLDLPDDWSDDSAPPLSETPHEG